jgi:serine/threonine protein kinase/tetratricopeptide (TPR) repeat protein
MRLEHWRQIDRLLEQALEREEPERARFLDEACAGDEALRKEIDSLIRYDERAKSFIERPAIEIAAEALAAEQTGLAAGQQLGAYKIESLLGAGGMGEVYLAEDTRLGRKVAIKFPPHESVTDERAKKRFFREAQAAAKLDHPNICAIHEVAEQDGRIFIVMQYVEGETLAARIQREPLSLAESLDLAVQVADALSEAHSRGIIHRDIKPQNIMVTARGQVKVLDFGLAKVVKQQEAFESEAETESLLTTPGLIVGTVPYMSPEQVKGKSLDARTDIFSFGSVLYEMITGHRPFAAESTAEIISAILTSEPPPLVSYSTIVPDELQRITTQALAKDRERRYQSMRELALDLNSCRREYEANRAIAPHNDRATKDKVVTTTTSDAKQRRFLSPRHILTGIALLVMVAVLTLAYALFFRGATTAKQPEIRSIAVLPLENLSGDPSQEYFADGMTEAIIGNLTQISALNRVISRTSVMRYKGSRSKSLPEIAAELKVDAVIEGAVHRSGGRVRVTVKLIPAATDSPVWSREYEQDLSDVLKLQGEVARAVAAEIRIQVTPEERARLAAARNINPQAHEAYLLGRYHFSKNNEQDWKQALAYFERATRIAPDYAPTYAGISDVWLQLGIFAVKPFKEIEPPARAAALQALRLDEQLAEAHISLANLKQYYDWDWTGSEAEFRRALELDPGGLQAHLHYGHLLMHLGRHDEAVREGQIAAQLDPLSSETQTALGRFLYRARRYEEALPHLQRAVAMEPRSIGANFRLGDVYVQLRRYPEAIAVFENGRKLTRDESTFQAGIARAYALMGRHREAREMISRVKEKDALIAGVYAALGDKDEAFNILEQAIKEHNSLLVTLKEDPPFESLHTHPRWKELLRRMNYPPQ